MARMEAAESKARYTSETFVDIFRKARRSPARSKGWRRRSCWPRREGSRADIRTKRASDTNESSRRWRGGRATCTQELTFLIRANDTDFVYYVESRGRGLFLRASPIDVSRSAKRRCSTACATTVLTSATLAVDGSFEYVKSRLGIRQASQVRVPSEFDYTRQALLYLPRRMPLAEVADVQRGARRAR